MACVYMAERSTVVDAWLVRSSRAACGDTDKFLLSCGGDLDKFSVLAFFSPYMDKVITFFFNP